MVLTPLFYFASLVCFGSLKIPNLALLGMANGTWKIFCQKLMIRFQNLGIFMRCKKIVVSSDFTIHQLFSLLVIIHQMADSKILFIICLIT